MGAARWSLPIFVLLMVCKVLTVHGQVLRLNEALEQIKKTGMVPSVVYAEHDDNPKVSFNKSMRKILSETDGTLLLFEDDVVIKNFSPFYNALTQLPDDWDLCYLGANLVAPIERYSENLFKTFGAWTTHAVMYRNPKAIADRYEDTSIMFDDWLKTWIHPNGKTFIISPMIAWQKPHQSTLWSHFADYTDIFNASANKLL